MINRLFLTYDNLEDVIRQEIRNFDDDLDTGAQVVLPLGLLLK
jgi:hypothetical protein